MRDECLPPLALAGYCGTALRQRELLAARATIRPLNHGHVRHVHRSELRMELTHRLRRPLRRALPFPAAGADDEPKLRGHSIT
jgi:hypothetical protein